MSPRTPLLLNLVILLVNFVLLCANAASDDRMFRAARRSAAAPVPWRRLVTAVPESPPGSHPPHANRATPGAIGPIPHTRLLKFLAVADGGNELSPAQRAAVVDALESCCRSLRSASQAWLRAVEDPRAARERIVRDVTDRLRAAQLPDEALARLVRVVVASAG